MIVQFNGRLCRISGTLLKGTKVQKVSMENILKKSSEFKKRLEKTIFNSESYQTMLASEKVLARDWTDRPIGYVVNLTRLSELRKSV